MRLNKSAYILIAVGVVTLQLITVIFGIGAGLACESAQTNRCEVWSLIGRIVLYGVPFAGAFVIYVRSRSRSKATLFLLVMACFDGLLFLLYWFYWVKGGVIN